MYVITGATGKVGGGIAQRLLKDGKQVKAIGRNADKLKALTQQGAQAAVGDAADATFLAKSFSGAEAVFLMVPPDLASPDIFAHYERMGDALVKALKESGVKQAVVLSSIGAELPKGNGPVRGLYSLEQKLKGLQSIDFLILRPGYFMENQYGSIGMIKGMGINGSPLRGDLAFAQIATRDIAEYAAKRMAKKDWKGTQIQPLMGPKDGSMNEMTAAIGKAIGKPDLKYVQFPYEDALKAMIGGGLSKSVAESFVEMNKGFNEGTIKMPARTPETNTPTTLDQFAQEFAKVYQAS